jgi:hypothetical protein
MSNKTKLATSIVFAILSDVTGRRGWRQEWDGFDTDIQKEILATWERLIEKELNKEDGS